MAVWSKYICSFALVTNKQVDGNRNRRKRKMAPMLCHLLQLQGPHCPHQCTHTEHIDAGLEKEKKKKA